MSNAVKEARAQLAAEFVEIVRGMGIDLDPNDGLPEAMAAMLEHLTEVANGRYAAGVADGRREAAAWLREHGHEDQYQSDRCSDVGEWYSVPSPDLLADALEAEREPPDDDAGNKPIVIMARKVTGNGEIRPGIAGAMFVTEGPCPEPAANDDGQEDPRF